MFNLIKDWFSRGSKKNPLRENMEKALKMKQEAGPQTSIPEHQTAHQGGVREPQMNYTDTALGKEGTYTENLSRSHNARVGDSGKTTGPGQSK
jgi:hypothetical protein